MQRYFLKLAFDGTQYHGWQVQENAISIQGELQKVLTQLFQCPLEVTGCGRTDTGVHAKEFYAHFEVETSLRKEDLRFKLNCMLPQDISVYELIKVTQGAHARFDATSRTYAYYIHYNKDAFLVDRSYLHKANLNVDLMNAAAKMLLDVVDFTSFSKLHTQVKTNNCNVTFAEWKAIGNGLVFTITADRFLRNMVRAIVGTLLDVGERKMSGEDFKMIIEKRDRCGAGASVPAHGLYLTQVEYPQNIYLPNQQ